MRANWDADCCGLAGRVLVTRSSGEADSLDYRQLELLMCGHHYRLHAVMLAVDGWTIKESVDEWSTKG